MEETKLKEAHSYSGAVKYGEKISTEYAYTKYKSYPTIYESEKMSMIDGREKMIGLEMSEQEKFFESKDNNAVNGKKIATTSIQPCQTYWQKGNAYMKDAFKIDENGTNYWDLLISKGSNINYWLASRCIYASVGDCDFCIYHVESSGISAKSMYSSNDVSLETSHELFPVVSIRASLIIGDATNGFRVNTD